MIRISQNLLSKLPSESPDLLVRIALGHDPKNPPQYIETYKRGIAFHEKGDLKNVLKATWKLFPVISV